jgi:ribulose-5-phosphate 4-epimerase/fuculose-1-phosphate aldolase
VWGLCGAVVFRRLAANTQLEGFVRRWTMDRRMQCGGREPTRTQEPEAMTTTAAHQGDFDAPEVLGLRADLALALRAAAHHGLAEGVCNHFSVELPDGSGRFLLNPRGLLWSEVRAEDIVMVDGSGTRLAGRHAVEPTAMFIHAAIHRIGNKACVLHTHMPHATALALTVDRGLDTTLSQNAMRFHGRVAADEHYNGLALDATEGERIARAMQGADVVFLGNHGVVVCGERISHAYDDLYYLERACMAQVLAASTGRPLAPVDGAIAEQVRDQTLGERLQSELFFEALRRTV